ncbi:fatty acid oxidation complex subunit alpha [Fulvitalea axinellae]|uniref:enoyl-CoA hydratase n=1 Tax=Fulvitalea axinellae TaxID=1182444 RepID=A0AAU9CP02_9BACT|nr:fatty acid oxidation complex subunit alpha [Fulvitalea axinellae]
MKLFFHTDEDLQQTESYVKVHRSHHSALVTLDKKDSPVNTVDSSFAKAINSVLDKLEADESISSVIFNSEKKTFIAGADLKLLHEGSAEDAAQMIAEVQDLYSRLQRFPKTTVAYIEGACLGGGLEFAMACQTRIANRNSRAFFQLPETNLGLIPGFGGTFRLPDLVGVEVALHMILRCQKLNIAQASEAGLVDQQVGDLDELTGLLNSGSLTLSQNRKNRHLPTDLDSITSFRKKTERRSKGLYPALTHALDALEFACKNPDEEQRIENEKALFAKTLATPAASRMVELFFTINDKKKNPWKHLVQPTHNIGIIGAGLMGSGIASVSVRKGYNVAVTDIHESSLLKLEAVVQKENGEVADDKLKLSDNLDILEDSQMVVEAIYENLEVKKETIRKLNGKLPSNSILASNTSAIPIKDLAEVFEDKTRVIGTHYFSPVQKMPLLEIIVTPETESWVKATALDIGIRQGKTCIIVNDGPGFYTTRILAPYLNEALLLLQEGVSGADLDSALESFGMPVGPVTLMDEIGIDVCAHLLGGPIGAMFDERGTPISKLLNVFVENGYLGRKNGKGFLQYDDSGKKSARIYSENLPEIGNTSSGAELDQETIRTRVVWAMVNEAIKCLEDDTLSTPADGDIGAILGLAFPKYTGGPFRFADAKGPESAYQTLRDLELKFGKRFAPATSISRHKNDNTLFHSS